MTQQEKINDWFETEFPKTFDKLVLDIGQGRIAAFGAYIITVCPHYTQVEKNNTSCVQFRDRRSAMSWCVADHLGDYDLARRIENLDRSRVLCQNDLHSRSQLSSRSKNDRFKETVSTKLAYKRDHLHRLENELAKCIDRAKYLQLRGFQNEIARARRT